jgi:hypothetical protein
VAATSNSVPVFTSTGHAPATAVHGRFFFQQFSKFIKLIFIIHTHLGKMVSNFVNGFIFMR